MTIVPATDLLRRAAAQGYAVPSFDVWDIASAEGALDALVERRAPGIIAIYSAVLNQPYARGFLAYARARAEELPAPLALLLDHGASLEECARAMRFGCTDVMFDGSQLPLPANARETAIITRMAHAAGVGVEAEVGHVGQAGDEESAAGGRSGFTDPAAAAAFVRETGVDYLAVAIGTAHGVYKGAPRLDLDLLAEIRAAVDVPLVLHGGTGLGGDPLRAAIACGIAKINVSTDLFLSAGRRLADHAWAPVDAPWTSDPTYFRVSATVREAFRERCAFYIDLFGAAGRA
jgi:ketose-bisphosphate aldolase